MRTVRFGKTDLEVSRVGIESIPIHRSPIDYSIRIGPEALSSAQVVDLCKGFAALGIQCIIFNTPEMHETQPLRIKGEVVHQVVDFPDASDIRN